MLARDKCVDKKGNYWFQPTALRGARKSNSVPNAKKKIATTVAAIRRLESDFRCSKRFPDRVIEALLQQYGMTSTWLDVVDNIWIALWFACYKKDCPVDFEVSETPNAKYSNPQQKPLEPRRSFIHMVRRDPRNEKEEERFAYIFLLSGKNTRKGNMEMIDLRRVIPSHFIRPHVQHGVLIRAKPYLNMLELVQGVIRIDLFDALEWLGDGRILLTESIFPPPNYDSGFQWLLENEMRIMKDCKSCFPIYC